MNLNDFSISEYDPTEPHDTWPGTLPIDHDHIELLVGPYTLNAAPGVAPEHFRGDETGPYGISEFDLLLLSDNPDSLTHPTSVNWLSFTAGTFVPRKPLKYEPFLAGAHPERRRGAASFAVRPDDEMIHASGIRGGQNWEAGIAHWPARFDSDQDLRLEFDIYGGWKFHGGKYEHSHPISATAAIDIGRMTRNLLATWIGNSIGTNAFLYPVASGRQLISTIKSRRRQFLTRSQR